jgi:3-keto-disaccharide hydrolase
MRMNRSVILLLIIVSILTSADAFAQRRNAPTTIGDIPLMDSQWDTLMGKAEFKDYNGRPAIVFEKEGIVAPKGLAFRNGTIEFDVEPAAMGAGLVFRVQSLETLEMVYFRPQANCATRPDCVQYAPFTRGVLLWDLFPQYQAAAPLRANEWNHVKVVISGERMQLFVNGATTPTLAVGRLEGDTKEGRVALVGPGAFANVRITPDALEGLAKDAVLDSTSRDGRLVRQWQLAPFSELPDGKEPTLADLPMPSAEWRGLTAERGGLINVTRVYGLPAKRPMRSLTWLKTTIVSKTNQSKKVAIGWSRELWVFVNGQRVFADKNLFMPATARKAPDGRLSLENGSFVLPLQAGDNEVIVALANNFYGWGLILRLEDLDGIQLARK